MKYFPLQVAIIIGAGLATGFGFSLVSKVLPEPKIKDNTGVPVVPKQSGNPGPTGSGAPTGQPVPSGVISTAKPPPAPADADADLISLAAAKAIFDARDSKNAVFIDARSKAEYLQSHVVGAMQLEKSDLDGAPPAKVLNYLPGAEIVVYCHGELCTDSANVVKRLIALNKGIGPMHIIKDGFPGWKGANYPVESGPEAGFQ